MKIYSLFMILFGVTNCLGTVTSKAKVKELINDIFPDSKVELVTTSNWRTVYEVDNGIYVDVIEEDI